MKVAFPIVIASSGSDIYYIRLRDQLLSRGIQVEIIPLGYQYEFVPFLHRQILKKLASYDLVHTNAEYGHLFKVHGKPLVVTLHHNVLDSYYQQFTTLMQKIYHYGLLKT